MAPITGMVTHMVMVIMSTDSAEDLLLLLNWMSPTFPIGNFAYSHGLEWAISSGAVTSAETLEQWIADLVASGSGWNDAVFFARCWEDDAAALNELALAMAGSAERCRETSQLGRNFNVAAAIWTGATAEDMTWAYPVAAGRACATCGMAREQALLAFLQNFCAAQVSVAVRLVPLGQMHGLRVLRNLSPVIAAAAARAAKAQLENLGSNTISAEVASMRHETLEPRIFLT